MRTGEDSGQHDGFGDGEPFRTDGGRTSTGPELPTDSESNGSGYGWYS